jgi:hypothetical protein
MVRQSIIDVHNLRKAEEGYFCCPFSSFHVIAWYIKMQSQNFCVYRF